MSNNPEEKPSRETPESKPEDSKPAETKPEQTESATQAPKVSLPPTPVEQLPKQPVELLQLTKTGGLTLPKEIRDVLPEKCMFAFWKDLNRIVLQPVSEADLPHLNLVEAIKEKEKAKEKEKGAGEKKQRKRTEKKEGDSSSLQPEPIKYLLYTFENQDKVLTALESAFWKFTESPPNMNEGLDRIKYCLLSFVGKGSMNDSRLRNAIINFICDVVEKMNLQELLNFAEEKIIPNISSKFLYEQSLISLINTCLKVKNNDKTKLFLEQFFKSIENYTASDTFAIMQSFKTIIGQITRARIDVPDPIKAIIGAEIKKFIIGFEQPGKNPSDPPIKHAPLNPANALELIDLLEKIHLVDMAHTIAENILNNLPSDAKELDAYRTKVHGLSQKPVSIQMFFP